ncbi:MAG: hypothetical protein ISR91_00300 [Candidatus Delongbacteria bacterium]|nr:hypothetical protein [bacterium]MBL7032563.1 hypothetical protein [Candidatus Delongbacteria bacterium]
MNFTEQEQNFIERFSEAVVRRRMTVPAIFFLESMTPLNFIASQGVAFFTPIVQIFMKAGDLDILQRLLENREFIPVLISILEKRDRTLKLEEKKQKQERKLLRKQKKEQA